MTILVINVPIEIIEDNDTSVPESIIKTNPTVETIDAI